MASRFLWIFKSIFFTTDSITGLLIRVICIIKFNAILYFLLKNPKENFFNQKRREREKNQKFVWYFITQYLKEIKVFTFSFKRNNVLSSRHGSSPWVDWDQLETSLYIGPILKPWMGLEDSMSQHKSEKIGKNL